MVKIDLFIYLFIIFTISEILVFLIYILLETKKISYCNQKFCEKAEAVDYWRKTHPKIKDHSVLDKLLEELSEAKRELDEVLK